jgi:Lipopolysaccharide-assembly
MTLKTNIMLLLLACMLIANACGIYNLSGANVEGKNINVHFIENVSGNVAPRLSGILTDKIRTKILNQTTLSNSNAAKTDYGISGQITNYNVGVAAVSTADISSQNRLSITVEIDFKNRLNEKANWVQSFTKFADYPSSSNLQAVENQLIEEISAELADQIFAKAFVNW